MVLVRLTIELAGVGDDVVEVATREATIVVVFVVLLHVEVDRAIRFVGEAVVHNLLHQLLLLDDVAGGVRLNAGAQHVELFHRGVEAVGVVLCHLHRLELFEARLLGNLVLTLIGIVLQVAHVGDVAHVAHLVAQVFQVAKHEVEGDGRTGVAQMSVAVDGRSANIHAHMSGVDRFEYLLRAGQRIVKIKGMFHIGFTKFLVTLAKVIKKQIRGHFSLQNVRCRGSEFSLERSSVFLVVTYGILVVTEFFLVVTEIHLAFTEETAENAP